MNHCNDFAPLLDNKNSYSYSYVMLLEIQLSRGEGLDPVNQFNLDTFLFLSQARTWISTLQWFINNNIKKLKI
jgi:hypothetical protein